MAISGRGRKRCAGTGTKQTRRQGAPLRAVRARQDPIRTARSEDQHKPGCDDDCASYSQEPPHRRQASSNGRRAPWPVPRSAEGAHCSSATPSRSLRACDSRASPPRGSEPGALGGMRGCQIDATPAHPCSQRDGLRRGAQRPRPRGRWRLCAQTEHEAIVGASPPLAAWRRSQATG